MSKSNRTSIESGRRRDEEMNRQLDHTEGLTASLTVRQHLEASAEFTADQITEYMNAFEHQEGQEAWVDQFPEGLDTIIEDAKMYFGTKVYLLVDKEIS